MLSSDHDVPLREEEFRLIRDLVRERFGIFFDDAHRESLRSRLVGRLSHLDLISFEEYYQYLRFGPERTEEHRHMISLLTNNETYFYREKPQLDVFGQMVLKKLRERKALAGQRQLRVLSAGCSTGEEAYTLAMIVYDSGQFFWNWEISVSGLDVDHMALEKARSGVYFHNSFRSMDPATKERHFLPSGKGSAVKDAIRKLVSFRRGNLLEVETYQDLGPLDVIFCRNVLIYFTDPSIRKVISNFHDVLAPGGFLLLGHAESLSRITDVFQPIRFPGTMIYQKGEPKEEAATAP
jgi:chemotaxis protein methyltransferase CheR